MKTVAIAFLLFALPLAAQTAHEDLKNLQDNSFLLEEAYNQDPGVVQHIGVFTSGWDFSFTEEWPIFGQQRHQISYDIPLTDDGLGDISINYRYQLLGDADADLAIAPRLSVTLPTSQDGHDTAVSLGLPISKVLLPRLATHTNIDVTFADDDTQFFLGQSLVYAFSSRINAHLEATWTDTEDGSEFVISPGVRWSYERPSGLQIVPGVAGLFGEDDNAVILYLSFEHPFGKR